MLGRPAGALWRIRLADEFHVVRISPISDNVTVGYSGTPLTKKLGIVTSYFCRCHQGAGELPE